MGGGLLQLVAYGAREPYLTAGNIYTQTERTGKRKFSEIEIDQSKFHDFKRFKASEPEMCSICHINMTDKEVLVSCPDCKKFLHKDCINKWLIHQQTCPCCRSGSWKDFNY
jgi:hypothetical protein